MAEELKVDFVIENTEWCPTKSQESNVCSIYLNPSESLYEKFIDSLKNKLVPKFSDIPRVVYNDGVTGNVFIVTKDNKPITFCAGNIRTMSIPGKKIRVFRVEIMTAITLFDFEVTLNAIFKIHFGSIDAIIFSSPKKMQGFYSAVMKYARPINLDKFKNALKNHEATYKIKAIKDKSWIRYTGSGQEVLDALNTHNKKKIHLKFTLAEFQFYYANNPMAEIFVKKNAGIVTALVIFLNTSEDSGITVASLAYHINADISEIEALTTADVLQVPHVIPLGNRKKYTAVEGTTYLYCVGYDIEATEYTNVGFLYF